MPVRSLLRAAIVLIALLMQTPAADALVRVADQPLISAIGDCHFGKDRHRPIDHHCFHFVRSHIASGQRNAAPENAPEGASRPNLAQLDVRAERALACADGLACSAADDFKSVYARTRRMRP